MRSVCIFCGSSAGNSGEFAAAAVELVKQMVSRDIAVVYGGGKVGLMGVVADTALSTGGRIAGVIPENLFEREVAYETIEELHVTASMAERKAKMAELSDAFIALPGGLGTLEELSEVLSWAQIGLHRKPCGLLNVAGYYDPFVAFLDHAVQSGFVRPQARALALVDDSPARLLDRLAESAAANPVRPSVQ